MCSTCLPVGKNLVVRFCWDERQPRGKEGWRVEELTAAEMKKPARTDADAGDEEMPDGQPDEMEPMLAGDEDPVPTGVCCPSCQTEMAIVAEGGFHGDYYLKDDTDAYCNYCHTRIPELDE